MSILIRVNRANLTIYPLHYRWGIHTKRHCHTPNENPSNPFTTHELALLVVFELSFSVCRNSNYPILPLFIPFHQYSLSWNLRNTALKTVGHMGLLLKFFFSIVVMTFKPKNNKKKRITTIFLPSYKLEMDTHLSYMHRKILLFT